MHNLRLHTAIEKAKADNTPKDVIERALNSSQKDASTMEEITYEGNVGPVAVVVEALSDNRKRTAMHVRALFTKHGGTLGTAGSVDYVFTSVGRVHVPCPDAAQQDSIFEAALEAGASDVNFEDEPGVALVICDPGNVGSVRKALSTAGLASTVAETVRVPTVTVELDGEKEETFGHFLERLHEDEDVQAVYHNATTAAELQ